MWTTGGGLPQCLYRYFSFGLRQRPDWCSRRDFARSWWRRRIHCAARSCPALPAPDRAKAVGNARLVVVEGCCDLGRTGGVKLRPMLQVSDGTASSRWYQATVGLRSGRGGDDYDVVFDGDNFILQLHRLDSHEHGISTAIGDSRGSGISLWFEAADRQAVEALVEKARASGVTITKEPGWNPVEHHYEATLVDPDGYIVVLNSPFEIPTGPSRLVSLPTASASSAPVPAPGSGPSTPRAWSARPSRCAGPRWQRPPAAEPLVRGDRR